MRIRTLLVALACLAAVVLVAPSAAATHVPVCWNVQRTLERVGSAIDTGDVRVDVDPSATCAVDCVWDSFTMGAFKYVLNCLDWLR